MELARVSSKGQITIPISIRKKLNLKEGDKILFVEEEGNVYVLNASITAFKEIQKQMKGLAKNAGLESEEDVSKFVEEVREEKWRENYEGND